MSGESVSMSEFKRWVQHHTKVQEQHNAELKEMARELKESNEINRQTVSLLREDVAATKLMIQHHVDTYTEDKRRNSETFSSQAERIKNIEETLKERESVFRLGAGLKWAFGVIIAGALTAAGAALAKYLP